MGDKRQGTLPHLQNKEGRKQVFLIIRINGLKKHQTTPPNPATDHYSKLKYLQDLSHYYKPRRKSHCGSGKSLIGSNHEPAPAQ
jgi:hypothetical protein